MRELVVPLFSQQAFDADRFQSHQWAEVPAEISVVYMSGGLKKMRRMVELYFGYRFSAASRRVRTRWQGGEPHMHLRFYRVPYLHGMTLVHLGRLRAAAANDLYRGYLEVLGGEMVDPGAIATPRPWPADMPWVAPSAGEFDVQREHERPPYLGTFEIRVQRTASGCTLHTVLQDFAPVRRGVPARQEVMARRVKVRLCAQPWQPMQRAANLEFLQQEIESTARDAGYAVRFQIRELPGIPKRLHAIY